MQIKEQRMNKMIEKLLPLGTLVYLAEGNVKLMIVGRGVSVDNGEEGNIFKDYVGVVYPTGLNPEDALFFNHSDEIEKLQM